MKLKANRLNQLGKLIALTAVAQLVGMGQGFAAGFEKGIMWGARSAGVAGIASPYIAGSQSLYFNPAGLANDKEGQDVSLNLSPASVMFKAPINNSNTQESSNQTVLPFGLTYSRSINDKLGWGIGAFVTAGAKADYSAAFPDFGGRSAEVKTDLSVTELSTGVGYKVSDDLKLGLAWRVAMVKASFALAQRTPLGGGLYGITNPEFSDLKQTNFTGFRFGAQYKLGEKTLLGLNYRSEINFSADGSVGGKIMVPPAGGGATIPLINNPATVKSTLPQQVTLGVQHEYTEWRALAEYVWTQYSRVGDINVSGNIQRADNSAIVSSGSNVKMDWKDEHQIRLGGEYLGTSWPIRFGYALTSQVTSSDYPRAAFVPPGMAHTLTLGTGQIFQVAEKPLQFDIAGEYSFSKASSGSADAGNTSNDFRSGEYAVDQYALHAGLTYAF